MNYNNIFNYMKELYPNACCELKFNKDYELLIAIVLSAQTTDKKVNKVTEVLFDRYRSIEELKDAYVSDIENIIREIGTYKKKSIFVHDIVQKLFDDGYDYVPNDENYLLSLNGVGKKTINVFLSEYYKIPRLAVDTHVNRVSKRLGLANIGDDVSVVEEKLKKVIDKEEWILMHHTMIFFGRYHCKSINPNCLNCKLNKFCKKEFK